MSCPKSAQACENMQVFDCFLLKTFSKIRGHLGKRLRTCNRGIQNSDLVAGLEYQKSPEGRRNI